VNFETLQRQPPDAPWTAKEAAEACVKGKSPDRNQRRKLGVSRRVQHKISADSADFGEKSDLQITELHVGFIAFFERGDHPGAPLAETGRLVSRR